MELPSPRHECKISGDRSHGLNEHWYMGSGSCCDSMGKSSVVIGSVMGTGLWIDIFRNRDVNIVFVPCYLRNHGLPLLPQKVHHPNLSYW